MHKVFHARLNSKGFHHIILPIVIILLVGIIGTYLVIRSRAATTTMSAATTPATTQAGNATDAGLVIPTGQKVTPELWTQTSTGVSVENQDGAVVTPAASKSCPNGTLNSATSTCYYWVGAFQNSPFSATGASADIYQADPKVGSGDRTSVAEIYVASADTKQSLEFGWYNGGTKQSAIFEYHNVNGKPTCFDKCGFVATKGARKLGSLLTNGVAKRFTIKFVNNQWEFVYNGNEIGYLPESTWGGKFKSIGEVQVYGEVQAGTKKPATTQMGNGKLGSKSGSAYFSGYNLIGSKQTAKLDGYHESGGTATKAYDYGSTTSTGFHFGGPGF